MGIFVDRFADMEITESVKVYELFYRLSKQLDGLRAFYSWCESATICRPADFPDVENITSSKLRLMDDFIRNRSSFTSRPPFLSSAANPNVVDDFSVIRALPAPDPPEHDEHNPPINPIKALIAVGEEEPNFITLTNNAVSANDHGDELAHALFGGDLSQPWDAFGSPENGSSPADWETALVQSASSLSLQKPSPGGGMDMLLLNSLYSQPNLPPAACIGGSSSSVAMLSWPETASGSGVVDPFSASLAVAPPVSVQMWEMEKKQRLSVEEQMAWQQYSEGMQGKMRMANVWHTQRS
ncbi:hypothetical protein HPP92_004927 [Vanilla planifolia]|uniref:AP180 N-terminal homology (ANTH) domain-containing protein n=1 Tax=Vanilla planifolia TaxID=51239 RepID=A0A835V8K8_VANPL|nr:hypothetical protein HPP92_004927 [Vanilla planifolia]